MIRGQGGPVGAQMIDATTGGAFSGSVSAFVTLDAGTQTAATHACTSEGNGYFTLTLTSSETDGELIAVTFVGSGAVPATIQIISTAVVPTPAPSAAITGPGVTTALSIATQAFAILNIFMPGEPIPDTDGQFALTTLNRLIGQWSQQNLTVPAQSREVFDIVADKVSYTIGTGGDLNTLRPPNQSSVLGASLILNASTPTVEVPLALLTDEAYRNLTPKGLTSGQPVALWYNPTFSSLYGTIIFWPIPNTADNDVALYLSKPLSTFADLTTTYAFPAGYEDALTYGLARRLAKPYGRDVDADLKDMADQTLMVIKRANVKISAMSNYFGTRGWYNFDADQVM